VLLVDDHHLFTSSLKAVLEVEPDLVVVGTAGTIEAARAATASVAPDVILLDVRLPDGDGISAMDDLRSLRPSVQIVLLTASTSEALLVQAVEHGAAGFIAKTGTLDEVRTAVRAAAQGEAVISPALLARLLPRLARQPRHLGADLTAREQEMLALLAEGLSNSAIAERLTVSVFTVRNHVTNLSAKLGAHSKLEALAIAVREGLLPS
jgi:DNA-binding NarL/FixJ family response regulator